MCQKLVTFIIKFGKIMFVKIVSPLKSWGALYLKITVCKVGLIMFIIKLDSAEGKLGMPYMLQLGYLVAELSLVSYFQKPANNIFTSQPFQPDASFRTGRPTSPLPQCFAPTAGKR